MSGDVITNPIVSGFHPDPSVCKVGEDYYLANSSFEYLPGVPIYHSRDLVTWTPIGHVVTRPGQMDLEHIPTLGGAWAPTIRHHDGRFWVVITDALGRGSLIFTADRPEGPWSDGTLMSGVSGIDPDLAWDDDGTCYITYSGLQLSGGEMGKHLGILQVRMDPETGVALEEPRSLWSGTGLMFPEGPHLYKIDGIWYLLIAEGGTERGHSISIARSDRPDGPFVGCPANPLLTASGTDRPIQNTGHSDLVRRPDGGWSIVLLGMRTRGGNRAFSPLGRETFRTNVTWSDGWPTIDPVHLGPPAPGVDETDQFDEPSLGTGTPTGTGTGTGTDTSMAWLSMRTPATNWSSLTERPGWLVIRGDGASMDDPSAHFLCVRQRHHLASFTTLVEVSEGIGGLSLRIDELHHVDVETDGNEIRARVRLSQVSQTWRQPVDAGAGPILLRITAEVPDGDIFAQIGPDVLRMSFSQTPGVWTELASLDGRYLSAETTASFTGRVCGVYAASGIAAFDWFHYEGRDV